MKNTITLVAVLGLLCGLMSMGFDCASAELTSAKLYIQRSDWTSAEKSLITELKRNPNNEEAWFLLGQVRGETKDYEGMNEAFSKALAISKEHEKEITSIRLQKWGMAVNSGVEHFNKGKENPQEYVEAEDLFRTAIAILPDSIQPYKNLTFCYLNAVQPDSAVPYLRKAVTLGKDVQCWEILGKIYYQKAMQAYEMFDSPANKRDVKIGMSKEEVRAIWENPASTNTSKPKNRKVVIDQYTYTNPPMTMTFENDALISWEENGMKYLVGSQQFYIDSSGFRKAHPFFDEAIESIRQGLAIEPNNDELHTLLTNALVSSGRFDEAEQTFKSGLEKDPQNKYYRYNYGALLLNKEMFTEAIEQLQKAVDLDPKYEPAVYNLATAHINWGVKIRKEAGEDQAKIAQAKDLFLKAVPLVQRVIELKPDNADMYEVLGRLQTNLGMSKEAEASFKKADEIRNGLDGLKIGMGQDQVKKIWGDPTGSLVQTSEYGTDETWEYNNKEKIGKIVLLYFSKGTLKIWQILK